MKQTGVVYLQKAFSEMTVSSQDIVNRLTVNHLVMLSLFSSGIRNNM